MTVRTAAGDGGLLAPLLPAAVRTGQAFGDLPGAILLPPEEAAIARAVPARRREFATTRHLAREALAALGEPAVALPAGSRREPLWPPGVVGSLTHCRGYRAAAVARRPDVAALGIDAEPHEALPPEVLPLVVLDAERSALRALPPGVHWDRLLFSAKESVYKTWYPLTGRWLGFEEARVDVHPDPARPDLSAGAGAALESPAATAGPAVTGRFSATVLVSGAMVGGAELTAFTGRFAVAQGLVVTAAWVVTGNDAGPRTG